MRKGFSDVSMADIIEECEISRGGLYFYFSSVEELFIEVVLSRNVKNRRRMQSFIEHDKDFNNLLENYFDFHKERLLHMQYSLRPAMLGYYLCKSGSAEKDFMQGQFENSKSIIMDILKLGKASGAITKDPGILADNVVFLIEGLSSKAMTTGISEQCIDEQFALLKNTLRS